MSSASLPIIRRLKPRRPCVPITIRSQPAFAASSTTTSATRPWVPSRSSGSAGTPAPAASAFALSSNAWPYSSRLLIRRRARSVCSKRVADDICTTTG